MPDVGHQGQRGVVPDVAPGGYEWLDVLRWRGRPDARDAAGGGGGPAHRLAHGVRGSVLVDVGRFRADLHRRATARGRGSARGPGIAVERLAAGVPRSPLLAACFVFDRHAVDANGYAGTVG